MKIKIGGSKLATHQDHFKRWRDGGNPGPLVCEIGAARGCNHGCLHCGFQQFEKYGGETHLLDLAAGKRFLDEFRSMGGVEVFFAGNGEPLLHPGLPELVRHGGSLGLDMTLSTNGALLDSRAAEALMPHLAWLRVSLNGGDPETYARVHRCPPEEFDLVRDNLRTAVAIRNRLGLGTVIAVQFVAYRVNAASVAGAARLHAEVGSDLLSIRDVFLKGRTAREPDPVVVEAVRSVEGLPGVQNRCAMAAPTEQAAGWRACHGINFRTNLDDRGNLFACNRHLAQECVYGNILTQSFRDIWASSRRRRVFADLASAGPDPRCQGMCQVALDNRYIESALWPTGPAL